MDNVFSYTRPRVNIVVKPDAHIPTTGSEQAAGCDLYANLPGRTDFLTIGSGATVMIPTGIYMSIPKGYFGAVFARSGIAKNKGLRPANCVGVIDSDYRGEIMVALHNDTNELQIIENNERIAQLVIMPYLAVDFNIVDNLDETERGSGGFGSTGTK